MMSMLTYTGKEGVEQLGENCEFKKYEIENQLMCLCFIIYNKSTLKFNTRFLYK